MSRCRESRRSSDRIAAHWTGQGGRDVSVNARRCSGGFYDQSGRLLGEYLDNPDGSYSYIDYV